MNYIRCTMKTRDNVKILLLQIRDDKETMLEELYEFVQFSKLHEEQFTVLNTFITPHFDIDAILGHDALFVGGSSDASVLAPDEFIFTRDCQRLIRHCYEYNIPVFASCYGFQLAVQELGGQVIIDKENMEMGTYQIALTDAAKDDPLLHDIPSPFWAVSGHKERALHIPEDAVLLAYSHACPYHAIKFIDKPFYGFQFHPEMDTKDLIARVSRYQERYLQDAEALEYIKQSAYPDISEANSLIAKFVDRIMLNNPR